MNKYLVFVQLPKEKNRKTYKWDIENARAEILGEIFFYPGWRQYVARFKEDTIMSLGCLKEVEGFLYVINKMRRP